MMLRRTGMAAVALAGIVSLGYAQPMHAQDAKAQGPDAQQSYDSQNWTAPRGYDEAYPENGKPNMVARQGYAAGFNQGEADASRGKKFKPTASDAYEDAKIPKGMNKDEFRQQYREAFVKGYTNGYKKA